MAEEDIPLQYRSENQGRKRSEAISERLKKTILTPPEWLEGLESVFTWGLHIKSFDLVRWNIPDKLSDYSNQGAFYGFERLGLLLAMLFYYGIHIEEQKLLKAMWEEAGGPKSESEEEEEEEGGSEDEDKKEDPYEPEKIYIKCKETVEEMAANEGDVMYCRIGLAFQHVLQATRAHMLYFDGSIAASQELARNIQPIENMPQECKAGFEGLKAKVIMSCVQDYEVVLPYLEKAMELDPEFGYWPYLYGKVLRRARREFLKNRMEEEFGYFEKAVSLERNPKFLVFLAQAYQEKALDLIQSRRGFDSAELFDRSVELYRECWSLRNDSAAIARRVGNGLNKMRSEYIDKTVAKEALLRAIEFSSNSCTHISLGKFYFNHEKNDEKALEHFMKAHPSDFGTAEIIRMNLIKDPNYDPYDIMQVWLKFQDNAVKQYRSFCDAVWYYLTFKRDVESAAKYLWRVLEKDNHFIRAKSAMEYNSYAFCVEKTMTVDLIELLVNEILLVRERNRNIPLEAQKDMKLFESFLQKILEKYPDYNMNPRPNLLLELKREVDRNIAIKRRRRYGSNNRRSETNLVLEEPVNWRNNHRNESLQDNNDQRHYRAQEGGGYRRYNQWNGNGNETSSRYDSRNSFSVGDDDRRTRGYRGDDRRRYSESQTSTSMAGTSGVGLGTREPTDTNRGRSDRQYRSFNNNRYDVTVTDWRSENKRQ